MRVLSFIQLRYCTPVGTAYLLKNRVAIDCIVVCMCVTNPQKQGHFKGEIGSQLENGAQEASHACMATARKWSGPGSQGGLHWATYRYRHLVCPDIQVSSSCMSSINATRVPIPIKKAPPPYPLN